MNAAMRRLGRATLASVLLWGCSLTTPRPEVHHYTLAVRLPAPTGATTKATLSVRPFSAHDPYNQSLLVYRTSPYQIDFYNYHRWAAAPAELITDWTRQYLRSTALFAKVYPAGEDAADFALNGRIRRFDEVDQEQTWQAVLSIDFWLTRDDQRIPLWFQSYTAAQEATKRNPAAVAEAMSRNLETILGKLIIDLTPVVAASSPP